MRECIKEIAQMFFVINTGVTIGTSTFITFLQRDAKLGVEILWQMIAVSLVTAFSSIILYSRNELNKKQILIRTVIHYIAINIIVLGSGFIFDWVDGGETTKVIGLIVCIFIVYIFVWLNMYKSDARMAKRLNQKIEEYNKDI